MSLLFLFFPDTGSTDGTQGYQSGEFVRYKYDEHKDKNWRPSNDDFKRADMFAFGVLTHFVLGKGSHPFSNPKRPNMVFERETRIFDRMPPNLEAVEDFEARHLIEKCVEHNAEERPSGERAAAHPYFYGTKERIAVIGEIARKNKGGREKEKEKEKEKEEAVGWRNAFRECWEKGEAGKLSTEGGQTNFYKDTEKDLVRFLRNAIEHGEEHGGGKGRATKLAQSIRKGGGGGGGGGGEFEETIVRWIKSKEGVVGELWTRLYDEGAKNS